MQTNKTAIRHLAHICAALNVRHIVFSPGSRCAPLVLAFENEKDIATYTIIDERSAAYTAVGMAQQYGHPVALVCTSGTAVLNYAPAIAEAYYQRIPLLILTGDRPREWIGQMDMQTIAQNGIFQNYIKKSFELTAELHHPDELWHNDRIICEAIYHCLYPAPGPVHINIPMREPLYTMKESVDDPSAPKIIHAHTRTPYPDAATLALLADEWKASSRIMILTGLLKPDPLLRALLRRLAKEKNVVILTESTSNLPGEEFVQQIDLLLESMNAEEMRAFSPDLLISIGGYVVSKKIKTLFRSSKPRSHWHIDAAGEMADTYQVLSRLLIWDTHALLKAALEFDPINGEWRKSIMQRYAQALAAKARYTSSLPFCDLKVYEILSHYLTEDYVLQWGNSTPVRYSNLINLPFHCHSYANRGVGGIDGTVSTALGAAMACRKPVLLVVGDLGFGYDSNALWNPYIHHLPLRMIVLQNGGGNIFRIIDGPEKTGEDIFSSYFETPHPYSIKGLAAAYNIKHLIATDEDGLHKQLPSFLAPAPYPMIFEIITDGKASSLFLKELFARIKKGL